MDIRELILKILNERDVDMVYIIQQAKNFSIEKDLDDVPTEEILWYTVPYIKANVCDKRGEKEKALELLREYCDDCEELCLVGREIIKLCEECSILDMRVGKVKLNEKIRKFKFDYIYWDDREWVLGLIEHFYMKATRNTMHIRRELELISKECSDVKDSQKDIECIRIDSVGRREKIFVDRIKPSVTLEEFANRIFTDVKNMNPAVQDIEEEDSSEKYTREELVKKDEENDARSSNFGNTSGMG